MTDDPYRLGLQITDASGRDTKWGPDSPDGRDIPLDYEHTSSLPGGDKTLNCSLLREFNRSNPDNNLADRVRSYGPGNETVWSGLFSAFPKQLGDKFTVEPAGVGLSSILEFDTGFQRVYVDRDLSQWVDMPLNEQKRLVAAARDLGALSFTSDGQAIICRLPAQALNAQSWTARWYLMPNGLKVAKIAYVAKDDSLPVGWEGPRFLTSDNDDSSGEATNVATFDETLRSIAVATPTRYASVRMYANGAALTPGAGANRRISTIAVYGDHGLTSRPFGDGVTPDGFYGSDLVADVLAATGQGIISYTTGPGGSIEPNTVNIPHLVFRGPTTGSEGIARISAFGINALELPEWGVYDGQFFWRTPDPDRLLWQARLSDGAKPRFEGDQLDDLFNGVLVSFTDPTGVDRVVGPPAAYWYGGKALADSTDPSLVSTDPSNPINAHGISQKWARLQLSQRATIAGAIALGAVFLAVQSQPQRRGQIDLTGLIQHPTKPQLQPVFFVKAGDWLQIPDSAEKDIKRRVVGVRYSHATRIATCDIGTTPFTVDALLEQMQAEMVGVFGG